MKKTLLACSMLALSISSTVMAQTSQDNTEHDKWLGGFVHYYGLDEDKILPEDSYKTGNGFGFEYGLMLDDSWAARFEIMRVNVNEGQRMSGYETGESFGVDALYFLEDTDAYVFGGLRMQNFDETRRLVAGGIGKHWEIRKGVNLITEVGGMHDFGQAHHDVFAKLGLAITFGSGGHSAPAAAPAALVDGDNDNDGVLDSADRCPGTPSGTRVDANGCPMQVDSDNDGVYDSADQCPNTPRGTRVDAKGCAVKLDSDGDGVYDDEDQCPDSPKTDQIDSTGCSVFVDKEVTQRLRIFFANNSDDIRDVDQANIDEFVAFMKRFPNTSAVIEGHASAPGDADYNMQLSQRRADAAKVYFVNEHGIDASRLTTEGFGETQLIDNANTAAAHRMNRRITARVSATVEVKAQ